MPRISKNERDAAVAEVRETYKIRIVTAASLFDGHDASINIMRRILQSSGAEVIHLGHNRSVSDIVECAIQEDAQGIAISSYQGGHLEYFKYMVDLLREKGAGHIKVFGGGGGVIVDEEIQELHNYGVARIFSVDDGRTMGLQGMIDMIIHSCDVDPVQIGKPDLDAISQPGWYPLARVITAIENNRNDLVNVTESHLSDPVTGVRVPVPAHIPVIGITGTGGAGKSSLTDELILRFRAEFPNLPVAIVSVDPSKKKTGGALLGDRIRMNSINAPAIYMRSLATRSDNRAVNESIHHVVDACKAAGFKLVIVETSGIGQSDTEITNIADVSIYVMTSEYGASTQLEKINMLDYADFVVINKFEKKGSADALRAVRKQYRRNWNLWKASDADLPVYPTMASQFNDEGVNRFFAALVQKIDQKFETGWEPKIYQNTVPAEELNIQALIPGNRQRYLSDVADHVREYHTYAEEQAILMDRLQATQTTADLLAASGTAEIPPSISALIVQTRDQIAPESLQAIEGFEETRRAYSTDFYEYEVRGKKFRIPTNTISLSGNKIPRVSLPRFTSKADLLRFLLKENLPGKFPYVAGVFPFKRTGEDPARMFAGEGTPERTNRRFHFISRGMPAKRLSTAFDSVTLYGEDPAIRPDIYGKIGNSGVNICTLDDMKKLYSGFVLTDPSTSVSMTINGPAPMLLAMFMNTAIDQEVERYLRAEGRWEDALRSLHRQNGDLPTYAGELPEGNDGFGLGLLGSSGDQLVDAETYARIKAETMKSVRGTVQADILKEDQAQNTCIFSTEFALRMMGDVQEFFTKNQVRNYYSVSISGYHIAEAGANPITQAAFTLANGFTYVEYYLSRGMSIDDFAPNLSFFFSNGLDPEYTVIGRAARRIWAVAMRDRYGASARSQMLKYHIQTSGRSLHAKEINFNDIRTTLQAMLAIFDNCNSLHTNAYDEAITTPTQESVRRALAIQHIINREFGLAKNENPLQGSFIATELTDLVEEAILTEFDRISDRGGVLGAMETMYQRGKIQDESLYYETLKHDGTLPIIGVNTFIDPDNDEATAAPTELIRSTEEEKQLQIDQLARWKKRRSKDCEKSLNRLRHTARTGGNIFETLLETVKSASLGQISEALYQVGGQYRRNM